MAGEYKGISVSPVAAMGRIIRSRITDFIGFTEPAVKSASFRPYR